MSGTEKDDRRKLKTQKLLNMALHKLLQNNNFKDITVGNICEEALVGRTTFYSHFIDKHDFLKSWLPYFWTYRADRNNSYEYAERYVNQFFRENETVLINLFGDVDFRTLEILKDFLCDSLGVIDEKYIGGNINQKYVVAANHYIGGIVFYVLWQVNNKFPSDVPMINKYFFDIIRNFRAWEYEE